MAGDCIKWVLVKPTIVGCDPIVEEEKLAICFTQVHFEGFLVRLFVQQKLSGKSDEKYLNGKILPLKFEPFAKFYPIKDFKFIQYQSFGCLAQYWQHFIPTHFKNFKN